MTRDPPLFTAVAAAVVPVALLVPFAPDVVPPTADAALATEAISLEPSVVLYSPNPCGTSFYQYPS